MQRSSSNWRNPPMLLPQLPKKRKAPSQPKLAPWWLYIIVVVLSMPIVVFIWAVIALALRLPVIRGEGWIKLVVMLLDTLAWSLFLAFNRQHRDVYDYFPWSLLVLYGSIAVMLLLFP